MLPFTADVFGVFGGLVLLGNIIWLTYRSWKSGRISAYRRNLILKRLEIELGANDYHAWEEFQIQLKLNQILHGSEDEQTEAIHYVRYIETKAESAKQIRDALQTRICDKNTTPEVLGAALTVLSEKMR